MIDHLSIPVGDYDTSKRFYQTVLESLGQTLVMEHPISGGGFGSDGKPTFWIKEGKASAKVHIAFAAKDRASVDLFYSTAMAGGGRDNGRPGLRPEYHPSYYGAFILDPDGNNVEAVCHLPR